MRWQCRSPLGTRIDKIQPFELPFQFNSIITRDVKVVEWNQNQLIRSLFSIGNKKWLIKDIWERYRWNPWRSISNKINYWKLQNLFGIICQSLKSKPGKLVRVNPVKTQHLRWKILTECHAASLLETVQDFLIKLGIKPRMHLLEISIFSVNNVILRLTKIMNRADKNWAHF